MSDIAIGVEKHLEIYVTDVNDAPVTGLVQADFGIKCIKDGGVGTDTVTLTEINSASRAGWYNVAYTATIASGADVVFHITHATYNILGWQLTYHVVDAGARVVTLTVTDADSGVPIPSVLVSVYNAALTVRVGRGETNASGQLVLHLDDGTYSLLLRKMGQYEFNNPVSLVVSGATALSITGSVFSPSASPSPETCIVYADEFDGEGEFAQVTVYAEMTSSKNFVETNGHLVKGRATTTSDAAGAWELALVRGVEYKFTIDKVLMGSHTIPAQASIPFKTLVGG